MTFMADHTDREELGVAEAKSRFSELIERVGRGERFLVSRRGRPVLMLVRPDEATPVLPRPLGLASIAGALGDWDELDVAVAEVYASRRKARDRSVPELD
jgi:hypothetical protein